MPTIEINGATLYYETFGTHQPDRAPVMLIHGSTGTGRSNWSQVAPLLAHEYFVIVPDCRGHGRSSNPNRSYSFKEMAADTAALVRALGYRRAHIIGHSNGGNVAAVVLLEHPEVVETAILQAANVWVSPDLVEKEPPLFDPDRVQRDSPQWMNEMIALHGETHGPEYWRDLLRWTVDELIRQPNYTPADLQAVQRPVLVIQGEHDRVNAPYHHAQFIARHTPFSELWIPAGVGHSVHEEILPEWIEKVLDFLRRRGDEDNPAIPWALVNRPLTDLRREPRRLSERVSQALLGEAVRILEDGRKANGEWLKVRLEHDRYVGWVKAAALLPCDKAGVEEYQAACTALVARDIAPAFDDPASSQEAGRLPFGISVPLVDRRQGRSVVRFPDGRCLWVADQALLPLAQRPRPDPQGIQDTLAHIRSFVGVPYLWGGRTPFGFDCSGLAQAFLRFMGLCPPRDAGQQYATGSPVGGGFLPGDLLFFGEVDEADLLPAEPGSRGENIVHVAISLGGDDLVHATGSADQVAYNSLNPESLLYSPWLREHLVGGRRFS